MSVFSLRGQRHFPVGASFIINREKMAKPADDPFCSCYFAAQHEQHTHPAMRALERAVLGCDFGGTSWTTKSQADTIPAALGLAAGSHLLEIGAGTGWPGLYIAASTACHVTLLDMPVSALRHSLQRAAEDKIDKRCRAVAASGAALPFANAVFNAISHSDVLCCLPEKLAMLKECRRVACDGAKMLFYVIAPKRGLSGIDLDRACEVGPPFVRVTDGYETLLEASAWKLLEKTNLTDDYLNALNRLTGGLQTAAEELRDVLGSDEFIEQLDYRCAQVDAIEAGLLEREMFLVQAI
jgi:SAM-dependent methyltransferase